MADPGGILINIALQAAIRLAISALTPKQVNEGPRLDDTTLTTSTYGEEISLGYGTTILSGNIIWGQDIEEVVTTSDISKGDPFSLGENITYRYFGTFAVGLCRRQIARILRIYADGKIIYDQLDEGTELPDIMEDLDFTVYEGTADQPRDPIIEADVGTEECPAYRGIAYVVFNRLPLENFGNRIPTLRFLVAFDQVVADKFSYYLDDIRDGDSDTWADYDPVNEMLYTSGEDDDGVSSLIVNEAFTGEVVAKRAFSDISPIFTGSPTRLIRAGRDCPYLLVGTSAPSDNENYALIEKESLTLIQRSFRSPTFKVCASGPKSDVGAAMKQGERDPICLDFEPEKIYLNGNRNIEIIESGGPLSFQGVEGSVANPKKYFGVFLGTNTFSPLQDTAVMSVVELTDLGFKYQWGSNDAGQELDDGTNDPPDIVGFAGGASLCQGPQTTEARYFFAIGIEEDSNLNTTNGPYHLIAYRVRNLPANTIAGLGSGSPDDPEILITRRSNTAGTGRQHIWYDEAQDILVWSIPGTDGPDTIAYRLNKAVAPKGGFGITEGAFQFSPQTLWNSDDPMPAPYYTTRWFDFSEGYIYRDISMREFNTYDTASGELLDEYNSAPTDYPRGDGVIWSGGAVNGKFFVEDGRQIDPNRGIFYLFVEGERAPENLDVIVKDIVQRSKLSLSDIDTTDLATQSVQGYGISRSLSYRAALEPLMTAFNFYGREENGQLVFRFHDNQLDMVIPEEDLVRPQNANLFEESRGQELETPRALFVKHLDPVEDDNKMVQGARRISTPATTMNSVGEQHIELPLYLTADEGARIAEIFRLRLPPRYVSLLPNDIVQVTAEGRVEGIRANRVSVGANLEVEIEGPVADTEIYTQRIQGVQPPGSPNYTVGGLTASYTKAVTGWLLDMPLLRDGDMEGRNSALIYCAGARSPVGSTRVYPGTALRLSIEGGGFTTKTVIPREAPWGVLREAMPDIPGDFWNGIQEASVDIGMLVGADQLASVSETDMVQFDFNTAALLKSGSGEVEIIGFRDVELLSNGDYRLSGFIRGKRGTDTFATGYDAPGTTGNGAGLTYLIFLDPGWTTGWFEGLNSDGASARYQILPAHSPGFVAKDRTQTLQLRALQPYEPTHIKLVPESSEYEIQWVRRTRVGGRLLNSAPSGEVPLSEDTEAYSEDGVAYRIRRTLDATSEAVEYTEAQMSADGFDAARVIAGLDPIYVRVFQLSSQVGRGMSKVRALYVEES